MADKSSAGGSLTRQFEASSARQQLLPSRYQTEGSTSRASFNQRDNFDDFSKEFFQSSRQTARQAALPPSQLSLPETRLTGDIADARLTSASGWLEEYQGQGKSKGRGKVTTANQSIKQATKQTAGQSIWSIPDDAPLWNEEYWLDNQLKEYGVDQFQLSDHADHPDRSDRSIQSNIKYYENNFTVADQQQIISRVTRPAELPRVKSQTTVRIGLLTEAESEHLKQLVFERYGFDVDLLLQQPDTPMPDQLHRYLLRDLGMNDPYNYYYILDIGSGVVDSLLIYEELVRNLLHKELFAVPLYRLAGSPDDQEHRVEDEDYYVGSGLIQDIAEERLRILNDLQYGSQADVFDMDRQQLVDYVNNATYIPLEVLKTITKWLLNKIPGWLRYRDSFGEASKGVQNAEMLNLVRRKLVAEEQRHNQQYGQQGLAPSFYRRQLPNSETELLDELKKLHLTYSNYTTHLTKLERAQLRHHMTHRVTKASFLPETRDDLIDAINKGSFKLYSPNGKKKIIANLDIPYPVISGDHADSRLITDKLFFDWLESTRHLTVKNLSRDFLTAYRHKDFEAVERVLKLTNRLLVPISFDLFKGSGDADIDELLLRRVNDGKLKFINTSSRL